MHAVNGHPDFCAAPGLGLKGKHAEGPGVRLREGTAEAELALGGLATSALSSHKPSTRVSSVIWWRKTAAQPLFWQAAAGHTGSTVTAGRGLLARLWPAEDAEGADNQNFSSRHTHVVHVVLSACSLWPIPMVGHESQLTLLCRLVLV